MVKTLKLSITGHGYVYMIVFTIASIIYLFVFSHIAIFLSMLSLSLTAIVSSVLSDKKNIKQFIYMLILSGARKKIITLCISIYILTRVILVISVYALYLAMRSYICVLPLMFILYILFTILLSEIIYKAMKR